MRFVDVRNSLGKTFCDYLLTLDVNYKNAYLTLEVPAEYKPYAERRVRFYLTFEEAFKEFLPAGDLETVLFLGKVLNNLGFYFESHELVEKYWLNYTGELKKMLQAVIQVAIANMHLEGGNKRGYQQMKLLAITNLNPYGGFVYGINIEGLKREIENSEGFIAIV